MTKEPEQLVTCPDCGTPNFSPRGLKAHRGNKHCLRTQQDKTQGAPAKGSKKGVRSISLTDLDVIPESPSPVTDEWANARRYASMVTSGTQVMVVAQIMCGFELIELQKRHGISDKGGRPKKLPNDSEVLSWPEIVKQQIGRSDDTARNWMNMAKAVAPRLKKLDGPWEAPALLALPPSEWPDGAHEAVSKTLKHVCDGETQAEWMQELGLLKRGDARSKNPGGFRPNALYLREWLKEEYPDHPEYLEIESFDELPAEIQKRYKAEGKRYEERLTNEQKEAIQHAADARAWCEQIVPGLTMGIDRRFFEHATEEQRAGLATALKDLHALVTESAKPQAKKALPSK